MSIIVETPFQNFTGLDGKPLTNGKVYIGQVGTDPTVFANQIPVFWDEALTIPAAQPLTTTAGYIVRTGTPSRVWVATDYSISVKNSSNVLVYYIDQFGVADLSIYAKVADLIASSGSSLIGYIIDGVGGVYRTLKSKLQGYVDVYDFGVVGDGVADDTANMQKALDHGALKNLIVHGLSAIVKITGPLTVNGPGLYFDDCPYGNTGEPGIYVTGTGYTAVTFSPGAHSQSSFTVYGTGNAANGVLFQNVLLSNFGSIRAYNLSGFGIKMNKVWDNIFQSISVELCGNASEYAFSMNDDGDTSNMTHIMRLQVERSNQKAIYISPNTLSCVIDNIHSEGQTPVAGVNTWTLGGVRCLYNGLRLQSSGVSANATALFNGAQTQYNAVVVEGDIATVLNGFTGNTLTFVSPDFLGITAVQAGNNGTINILGGAIARLRTDAFTLRVYGAKIAEATIYFANGDPSQAVFTDCNITLLYSGAALSAGTFVRCKIGAGSTLLAANTVLKDSTINLGSTYSLANSIAEFDNSSITCGTLTVNTAFMNLKNGSKIIGNLTMASNLISLCDSSSYCTGTVTGWGAPTSSAYFPSGVSSKGMRNKNIAPTAGQPKGWSCTVGGSPGTWVSEGNL